MLAVVIAATLASRRLLVEPGEDLVPSENLVYLAALVIILPEVLRFIFFAFFYTRYLILPETIKITGLWEPTDSSLSLYYLNKDKSEYPIGGALEVLSPGNITETTELNGWDPEEISFEVTGKYRADENLTQLARGMGEEDNNRKK